MNYHVKKRKKSRYTYRLVGFGIFLVCMSQIVAFVMGFGQEHRFGTIVAFAFLLYGIYLFAASFRSAAYDMDFEFRDSDFVVHTVYGEKTYSYDEVTDLNQIIPENELFYSIIQIGIGKKQFILPFSYKKEVADKIYSFLKEHVPGQQNEQTKA